MMQVLVRSVWYQSEAGPLGSTMQLESHSSLDPFRSYGETHKLKVQTSNLPKYMVHIWYQSEAGVSWSEMRLAMRITLQQESYSYLTPFESYGNFNSIK